jgi:hypothetical protein
VKAALPVLLLGLHVPLVQAADAAGAVLDRVAECASVADRDARLACFDREVGSWLASRRAAEPAPRAAAARAPRPDAPPAAASSTAVTAAREAAANEAKTALNPSATARAASVQPAKRAPDAANFGAEQLRTQNRRSDDEEATMQARIAGFRDAGGGVYVILLDNDQAWRHEDAHRASFLRVGDPVVIRRGSLGSYWLHRESDGTRNGIRVTRIR